MLQYLGEFQLQSETKIYHMLNLHSINLIIRHSVLKGSVYSVFSMFLIQRIVFLYLQKCIKEDGCHLKKNIKQETLSKIKRFTLSVNYAWK